MQLSEAASLLQSPGLSLGLSLAVAVPLLVVGFLFWWLGRHMMKPAVAIAAALLGAGLGLLIGGIIGGKIAMMACTLGGMGAGAALGFWLFRFGTAVVAAGMTFLCVVSFGWSLIAPASINASTGTAQTSPVTPGSAPGGIGGLLSLFSTSDSSTPPVQALSDLAKQSVLQAKAVSSLDAHNKSVGAPAKEYVDVRQLRKGSNTLQVQEIKDQAGHRRLVIRDQDSIDKFKAQSVTKPGDPTTGSSTASVAAATLPEDPAALINQLRSSGNLSDEQAQQFAALLGSTNAASAIPLRTVAIILIVGAILSSIAFGLALWKHRHAVAIVSAAIGSCFFVGAISILAHSISGPTIADMLAGITGSLLTGGLWFMLTSSGAFLQLRRDKPATNQQSGIEALGSVRRPGMLPRASAAETSSTGEPERKPGASPALNPQGKPTGKPAGNSVSMLAKIFARKPKPHTVATAQIYSPLRAVPAAAGDAPAHAPASAPGIAAAETNRKAA